MKAPFDFILRQTRARPLAVVAALFLLGVLAAQGHPLPAALCAGLFALAAGAAFLLRHRRAAMTGFLLLAGFAAGMARMTLALDAVSPVQTRYSVRMVGRVASEPFNNPDTGRLISHFQLESVNDEPSDLRLRLYLRDDEPPIETIRYGQRLALTGHIWQTDPVTNPYEFDFGAYLNRQGLSAYATAKLKDVEILEERRDPHTLVIAARRAVSERIDALFPQSAGMMRALILGDRSLLSEELRQSLNRTGTAHLISISGLHVTVLAAMLSLVLRRFMSRGRANLITIALLIPYGALIGFTAPFVRALIMFALICFAPVAGYPRDAATRLGAALLAYLLINPMSIGEAGFALSFSASAGIILLLEPVSALIGLSPVRFVSRDMPLPRQLLLRAREYVLSLLAVSLAAQLATLPSVIAFFGVQSIISLPFNLLCVPLCMAGYVVGLAVLLISVPCMPLAALMARLPDALFALLTSVTRLSSAIPVASVRIGRYSTLLVLLHWCVVIAASALVGLRLSLRRFMPLMLLVVAGLASLAAFAGAWRFSLVFLDAEQADCAVVRTRGHTYMIDVGDTYTPAADYLNATCLHLDGIFLTHPHNDHAGGLPSVLSSFRPDVIYVPQGWFEVEEVASAIDEGMAMAEEMGVEIRQLAAFDTVRLSDTARLDVYSPTPGERPGEVNDMSLLTLISCEGHTALFTGDLSVNGEPELIPDAEVLKVAHHGSAKATSQRFVDACTPKIAVISVGENNFGHPAEETLERLKDSGAAVLVTRQSGAITLTPSGGEWRIDNFLEAQNELE